MRRPPFYVVARREFLERVRTWWFAAVTTLGPVALVAIVVIPAWLEHRYTDNVVTVSVIDRSGIGIGTVLERVAEDEALAQRLSIDLDYDVEPPDRDEADLLGEVRRGDRNGYMIVPADVLDGGEVIYKGDNATNFRVVGTLRESVAKAVTMHRADAAGVSAADIIKLVTPPVFRAEHTTGSEEAASGAASVVLGYVSMFVLYMAILLYAVNVLRSVVQEKTTRVVEIVVSSVRPNALMLGKILGVGAVGLFQLAVWAVFAVLILQYRETVLGWFGVEGAGAMSLPELDVRTLVVILGYFVIGFFFYAALYAAVGAMVDNDQEAQQLQTPMVLLLVIPVACVQLIANDPRSDIAAWLTMIPFSSPVLMPMRYVMGGADGIDVVISLGILAVSTAGAVWLSARIYRVGILMYGKRPSLREVWRWIRYS